MFLSLGALPSRPDAIPRAAQLAGLTLADATRLLSGTFPRILLRAAPDPEALVAALLAEGYLVWISDPAQVQGDDQRLILRDLTWTDTGFLALDSLGNRHDCPFVALRLFQRGARSHASTVLETSTLRKVDLGRALLSGGMMITKKVTTTTERTTHAKEPFLLVQRSHGLPDLMIYEHRMSYQCLGAAMAHATLANLGLLAAKLQSLCPQVPLDDRVGRPGFTAGLPMLGVDPIDLGLFMVSEARLRGC